MNIKTLAVFALFLTFTLNIFAQENPVTFSYEVGYANQLRKGNGLATLNLNGLRMGAFFKYNFTNRIFGNTGLYYEYLHYNNTQRYSGTANFRQSTSANQLNLPILAGYELPLFSNIRFFAFGGPTFRLGLSENLLTATTFPKNVEDSIKMRDFLNTNGLLRTDGFSNLYKDKDLARFSILLSIGGGFKWDRFYLKSGYDFGLTNINQAQTSNNAEFKKKRITQGGWYVSLGYNF